MIVKTEQYVEMYALLAEKLFTDQKGYSYRAPLRTKLSIVQQTREDFWHDCVALAEDYLDIIGIKKEDEE